MTAQTQTIQFIPLNKLVVSPRNVRRKDRKADIDTLAASIAACGLLQNLCVVPADGGRFEVDAGGRRLLALKQLAKVGVIARDFEVPCHVVALDAGREISLAENVQRVAMDAMDEVEAYAALIGDGATPDQVAHRFGVTHRHVRQRLALAALSPKIKAAWKRGEVNLEAARAFCLVEDHARQEAVFRSLGRPVTHAASVRARLMEGRMRATDRLALFVGLEAYELAGGAIVRDLFDADPIYVEDPALMTLLAEDKLKTEGAAWLAQGWSWVDIRLGSQHADAYASVQLYPEPRELTDVETAELQRLRAELEALDEVLDRDAVEDDPRWETRDDIAASIERLRQAARVWDKDLMAHAGVILSLDPDGAPQAATGVIRKADEKTVRAIRRDKESALRGDAPSGALANPVAETAMAGSTLPKILLRELSQARTRALRLLVARDRGAALALAVASMISRAVHHEELSGIGTLALAASIDDLEALEESRRALMAFVPHDQTEVLAWCLDQPTETLLALLAMLVAGSVDLTHEKGAPSDTRRRAIADTLAEAVGLDMRTFWRADASYWTRLPKSELLAALAEAPTFAELPAAARETQMKALQGLKRDELAARAGIAFEDSSYLPGLLITHVPEGAIEVTTDGLAAIAAA